MEKGIDVVLDLNLDDEPRRLRHYADAGVAVVGGCAVKKTVKAMRPGGATVLFGLNALPTFLNSPMWEVSADMEADMVVAEHTLVALQRSWRRVADSPGMVRPRVIAMIINEAFWSLQEQVAAEEEIDRAMKLATAFPLGPFEWCRRMGIRNVYDVLQALAAIDPDRYRICPLLRQQYEQTLSAAC